MSFAAARGGYELLALTPDERLQIEAQLSACFALTAAGARTWVDTSERAGMYYGWKVGETVAASVAFEPLGFALGSETFRSLLLQSHYVHPVYRGRGYRITTEFLDEVLARHGAAAIVLCLYEDELARYWGEVGFVQTQFLGPIWIRHAEQPLKAAAAAAGDAGAGS
jgi:GNAT superfamily N-acetyltransferase